jgi:PAS domain S-box-containing protein
MLVDLNGVILHCNHKGKELFAKDGQELTGRNQNDFLPPEINAFVKSLIRGGALFEQCSIGAHLFKIKGSLIRGGEKEAVILAFDRVNEGLVSPT